MASTSISKTDVQQNSPPPMEERNRQQYPISSIRSISEEALKGSNSFTHRRKRSGTFPPAERIQLDSIELMNSLKSKELPNLTIGLNGITFKSLEEKMIFINLINKLFESNDSKDVLSTYLEDILIKFRECSFKDTVNALFNFRKFVVQIKDEQSLKKFQTSLSKVSELLLESSYNYLRLEHEKE